MGQVDFTRTSKSLSETVRPVKKDAFVSAGFLYFCLYVLFVDPDMRTPNLTSPSGSTLTPAQSFTSEAEQQTETTAVTGRSTEVSPNTFTSSTSPSRLVQDLCDPNAKTREAQLIKPLLKPPQTCGIMWVLSWPAWSSSYQRLWSFTAGRGFLTAKVRQQETQGPSSDRK